MAIKPLYYLEQLPDESISEEEEGGPSYDMQLVMEEIKLGAIQLSHMVWTQTKYKPQQFAQFIFLLQNKNYEGALEVSIKINSAYKFRKQWK